MKFASFGISITEVRKTLIAFTLATAVACSTMLMSACNAQEFAQKFNQYAELIFPAASSVASILALFGIPVPAAVMPLARAELTKVESLMTDFANASIAAQPGIRTQLVAAMQALQADLGNIFQLAHVQNPDKQAEITALITLIGSLVQEMLALIPTSTEPAKLEIAGAQASVAVHSKGDFVAQFNSHIEKLEKLSPGMKFHKLDGHSTITHALTLGLVR